MRFLRFLGFLFVLGAALLAAGAVAGYLVVQRYTADLPDYTQLAKYDPPVVTRVLAGDGRLLAEYAIEKRVFVPIGSIPKRVISAFLAAEDKSFYSHPGIDILGIVRAGITNLTHMGTDRRPVGASTITQQVAKNFLLRQRGLAASARCREIMLALRIEQAYSKDRILELYLNQIYLGAGNYGVTAAALNYFNKPLDELTHRRMRLSRLSAQGAQQLRHRQASRGGAGAAQLGDRPDAGRRLHHRRGSRGSDGRAAEAAFRAARPRPVTADYFAEEVRRELVARFGEDALYKGGLTVRTSLDPRLQAIADKVLHDGLVKYDRAHGFRGPDRQDRRHRQLAAGAGRRAAAGRALRLEAGRGAEHRCQDRQDRAGRGQRRADPAGRAHLGAPCRPHQPQHGRRHPQGERCPGSGRCDRRRARSTRMPPARTIRPIPMGCARSPRSAAPWWPWIPIPAACSP